MTDFTASKVSRCDTDQNAGIVVAQVQTERHSGVQNKLILSSHEELPYVG